MTTKINTAPFATKVLALSAALEHAKANPDIDYTYRTEPVWNGDREVIGFHLILMDDEGYTVREIGDAEARDLLAARLNEAPMNLRKALNTPASVGRQAHIVWNEGRNEGVIFVDQEPGESDWPLTAADDAYQASTGVSRRPGIGSALAEVFYGAYDHDEERPIQTIPLSVLSETGDLLEAIKWFSEKFSDHDDTGPEGEGWQSAGMKRHMTTFNRTVENAR